LELLETASVDDVVIDVDGDYVTVSPIEGEARVTEWLSFNDSNNSTVPWIDDQEMVYTIYRDTVRDELYLVFINQIYKTHLIEWDKNSNTPYETAWQGSRSTFNDSSTILETGDGNDGYARVIDDAVTPITHTGENTSFSKTGSEGFIKILGDDGEGSVETLSSHPIWDVNKYPSVTFHGFVGDITVPEPDPEPDPLADDKYLFAGAYTSVGKLNALTGEFRDEGYYNLHPKSLVTHLKVDVDSMYSIAGDVLKKTTVSTGEVKWEHDLGYESNWLSVYGGDVFVSLDNKTVRRINGSTGLTEWETVTEQKVYGVDVVGDGYVYAVGLYGMLWRFDVDTGSKEMLVNFDDNYYTVVVDGGFAYAGTNDGSLVKIDISAGTKEWVFSASNASIREAIDYYDGAVYFGDRDGNVFSVDTDGNEVWSVTLSDFPYDVYADTDGRIYVSERASVIRVLDSADGSELAAMDNWYYSSFYSLDKLPSTSNSPSNSPSNSDIIADGLEARYTFENDDATDSSGNNYDATLFGNPTFVTGYDGGRALSLDGNNDYLEIPSGTGGLSLDSTQGLTAGVWVKAASEYSDSGDYMVINFGLVPVLGIKFNSDSRTFSIYYDGTGSLPDTTHEADGNWHHYVLRYDPSTTELSLYIDGVQEASVVRDIDYTFDDNLVVGYRPDQTRWWLPADVYDVRIYSRSLTSSEISDIYNGTEQS
jgi:hypothetical protein